MAEVTNRSPVNRANARRSPTKRTASQKSSATSAKGLSGKAIVATLGTIVVGAGIAAIGAALFKRNDEARPGSGAKRHDEGHIRNAGEDSMRTTNQAKWTAVDQASDESFPASDPPGTY